MFLGFLGEQDLTLDEKGRLVLPAKFKVFITDPEDRKGFFILADPLKGERCLRLYTRPGYARQQEQIKSAAHGASDPLQVLRIYAAHSEFALLDSQSRFVIPPKLVDFAGLGREVVMVGVDEWLEIWDRKEWAERARRDLEKVRGAIAEGLKPKR